MLDNTAIPFLRGLMAITTPAEPGEQLEPWAEATLYQFERVDSMAEIDGPKLVYAHFLVPHRLCVFLEDGNRPPERHIREPAAIHQRPDQSPRGTTALQT